MKRNFTPFRNLSLSFMTIFFWSAMIFAQKNQDAPNAWSIVATYSIPGKASGLAYDGTYIYFGI